MKRFTALLTLILALAAAGAALAASHPAKIKLRKTAVGKILTNGSGFTVYVFARDKKKNTDTCVRIPSCTSFWPPVVTHGKPVAGPGVKASLLGTIKLPNGKRQVTYAGHALYGYIGDSAPGETSYVGVSGSGGKWYAISATGKVIK